ncbi:MAG: serine--tRNA ligase, partial [Rhodospirillaceae bacterium]|nr:serine--tRNA ligase [Rhodospirillaceae bacterium]
MHDIKSIRDNPQAFDAALTRRNIPIADPVSASHIIHLDSSRRLAQTKLQEMQEKRNEISREIGVLMGSGDKEAAEKLKSEVAAMKDDMQIMEEEDRVFEAQLEDLLASLPNILDDDVPEGTDEAANVERHRQGEPTALDFTPKDHVALGTGLGLMDFETAAKMSGARFVILKGALARMERGLAAFMLDLHTREFGYTEISPPTLVRDEALFGTGQLPKFGDDLFRTTNDHWLIPTAEVPLTNMVSGEILDGETLPLRFTAHTQCFRSEAGAAGK